MHTCTDNNIHRGMIIFQNKCQRCHTIRQGETPGEGPNLFGVFGRIAGSTGFYGHSEELKNSNIIWNRLNLELYLKNPKHRSKVPGNVMFYGASVPSSAHLVVSFLESISPTPAPISEGQNKAISFNKFCEQYKFRGIRVISATENARTFPSNHIPPMIPLQWQFAVNSSDASDLDTAAAETYKTYSGPNIMSGSSKITKRKL